MTKNPWKGNKFWKGYGWWTTTTTMTKMCNWKSEFLYLPNNSSLFSRILAEDKMTECFGLWHLTWGLAGLVGSAIIGPSFDAFGSYRSTLVYKCNCNTKDVEKSLKSKCLTRTYKKTRQNTLTLNVLCEL